MMPLKLTVLSVVYTFLMLINLEICKYVSQG